MNKGLLLSLLLLLFIVAITAADAMMVSDAVEESEALLAHFDTIDAPSLEDVAQMRAALERNRFLYAVSMPLHYLTEYESALATLEAAIQSDSKEGYAEAHRQALLALKQMKRSALFSPEQIF